MKYLPLSVKAIVATRAEVSDQLKLPGDAVLIQRDQPRWLLLKCPCGCSDEIPVNLDRRAGKAWRFYRDARLRVSVFPSIWRDTGCGSHFIVWRDQILLFGREDDELTSSPHHPDLRALARRLLERWPLNGWASYVEIADELDEIPWDVLDACRDLARANSFDEGRGPHQGLFRRR